MSLFREEVLRVRENRLHGDVSLVVPASWQAIGLTIFVGLFAIGLFLSFATYARVVTVSGTVVPDSGVSRVLPLRAGVLFRVMAAEGQVVRQGQPLLEIRSEDLLSDGGRMSQRLSSSLRSQHGDVARQIAQHSLASSQAQSRLSVQAEGMTQEIATLDQQIAVQRELVNSAAAEVERTRSVALRGFVSRREVQAREDVHLSRRQQLLQLEQARGSKRTAREELLQSAHQARAEATGAAAQLTSSRAAIQMRMTEVDASRGYVIVAPSSGRVTAVTARVGQPVDLQTPLMSIIPSGSRLRAELEVPTSAAGFVEVGQEVRLAIDAFPYQRFGTVDAVVTWVSAATVGRPDQDGVIRQVYLVGVEMPRASIPAFGRRQPLLAGMTLTARIIAERQSLLEWLFQPLFAVRNR